jgi:hypothetical protein
MSTTSSPIEPKCETTAFRLAECKSPSLSTDFMLNLIAYNLIRIPKLLAA